MKKNAVVYNVSRNVARKIMEKCSGRFFGITYITKKSGKVAKLNGRLNVTKYLKGGKENRKEDLITAFDVKSGQYRKVFLDQVIEINADNKKFIF